MLVVGTWPRQNKFKCAPPRSCDNPSWLFSINLYSFVQVLVRSSNSSHTILLQASSFCVTTPLLLPSNPSGSGPLHYIAPEDIVRHWYSDTVQVHRYSYLFALLYLESAGLYFTTLSFIPLLYHQRTPGWISIISYQPWHPNSLKTSRRYPSRIHTSTSVWMTFLLKKAARGPPPNHQSHRTVTDDQAAKAHRAQQALRMKAT